MVCQPIKYSRQIRSFLAFDQTAESAVKIRSRREFRPLERVPSRTGILRHPPETDIRAVTSPAEGDIGCPAQQFGAVEINKIEQTLNRRVCERCIGFPDQAPEPDLSVMLTPSGCGEFAAVYVVERMTKP